MRLTTRMNLVIAFVVLVMVAGFSGVFRFVVLESFLDLDGRHAADTIKRCRLGLDREVDHLAKFVHDWSSWDDTYRYVADRNKEYILSNLTNDVFFDQRLNLIHIYDAQGTRIWAKTYGPGLKRTIDLDLARELDPATFHAIVDQNDPMRHTAGIVMTSLGPLIVSSNPVLTSENKGPSRGALVMGRFLSEEIMGILSQQTGVNVTWKGWGDRSLPETVREGLRGGDVFSIPASRSTTVFTVVRDVGGRPALVLSASIPRQIAVKGRWAYTLGLVTLLSLGFAVVLAVSVILKTMVIRPIERLSRDVLHAGDPGASQDVFRTDRTDEIGVLSREFGAMFGELSRRTSELASSERRLRQIIDFLPDATYAVDRYAKIIAWNRAMEQLTGIGKEEMEGKDITCVAESLYGRREPMLSEAILGMDGEPGSPMGSVSRETHAPLLNGGKGAYLWVVAAPLYGENNDVDGAIECMRDITQEKKARDLLHRLGSTVEQLLDGVLMTDLDGTIRYMNPAWSAMHLCKSEDMIGRYMGVFHTEEQMTSEVKPFLEEVLSKGWARSTIGHIAGDDRVFKTLSTSFVLKDHDGNPTAVIWICRDITEEIRLEDQLRQAQKMEVVGRLAGGVAHDLNNMLSPILGYAEIILAELDEAEPLYDDIMQIKNAAERAKNLTQELLAFSRKQVLEVKVVDLSDVVNSYAKMLRRTIREDISIQIHHDVCTKNVKVDVGRMGQVLMNLAVNSQDAMPSGGTITIETSQVMLDETYAMSHQGVAAGEYVVLTFSDTGSGMDKKIKEHIFEPFFTTKDTGKGTGLGLATVYGIVRQHGGHISVYSEPGRGTTFRIYFPAVNTDAQDGQDCRSHVKGVSGSETIAVAEDDPHVRALACDILRKHGYTVVTADQGQELLDILKGSIDSIDLLLTDVIMPDMNGRELYERLREYKPDLKVLYMSGYTGDIIARHGMLEEGVQLVQKPFSMVSLTQKIRQVLDA